MVEMDDLVQVASIAVVQAVRSFRPDSGSVLRTWVSDDDQGLARTMAALFANTSSCSVSGTLSATMPAPAW